MLLLKLTLAAIFVAVLIFCTGCNNQPKHPNQINTFDGASYDSLTAAHAALASLRTSISTTHRGYIAPFNEAASAYSTAFTAYSVYRTNQAGDTPVTVAIANLTVSIVALENTFQSDMKASPAQVQQVRMQAAKVRARVRSQITVSDILTELEIAASIASTIPATQPYSGLAAIVIKMTQQSLAALGANSGQAIDLSTIQPLAPIQ
jgi:ABC-type Fe3+-siderophore transport system permease subunit